MDGMDLTCGHFVNPFTDIGFKIIFGQPASKELLITLLNELLAGEHRIENLIFLDKENHSDSMADAGIIYVHIPADTRSAFPVISVQSPVSIQCCWQS